MSDRDPSQERLLELFEYRDGSLFNKTDRNTRSRKGSRCGHVDNKGYERIRIDGKNYLSHRLIYIMHNGDIEKGLCIDHKNCIKDDNRIENLRVVTYQENHFNRSTAKGYSWIESHNKYKSQIVVNGKTKYLGYFVKEEDAAQAYQVAKEKYHIIGKR
jgi:hypothetical protein